MLPLLNIYDDSLLLCWRHMYADRLATVMQRNMFLFSAGASLLFSCRIRLV